MQPTIANYDPSALTRAWTTLRAERGLVRQRDAALALGVTEAQLVAARCGDDATRLTTAWQDLVRACERLGPVMALTRNDGAVIEKDGVYRNVAFRGAMGQVVDDGIDLRLMTHRWASAFAIREPADDGTRRSIQIFDAHGVAVHKVHLRPHSDALAFEGLVERFADPSQTRQLSVEPASAPQLRADDDVDADSLRAGWAAMTDPHDVFPLLRAHGVDRLQAVRLLGADWAVRVADDALGVALEAAALRHMPVLVFVRSDGAIQIHTGPIHQVVRRGDWLNVLDPGFNLHVREDAIASAWAVRKPTADGDVYSLELFDAAGQELLLLFGHRAAGPDAYEPWIQLWEEVKR